MLTGRPRRGGNSQREQEGDHAVLCLDEQSECALDSERWRVLAADVLAEMAVPVGAELNVLFVAEEAIAELNVSHMGKVGPTDVLAFPIDGVDLAATAATSDVRDGEPLLVGDVVICPAVAARQAPEHAGTFDDEMALLLVHGILHVLGHDHDDAVATAEMRRLERSLLERHHWHAAAPSGFRQEQR